LPNRRLRIRRRFLLAVLRLRRSASRWAAPLLGHARRADNLSMLVAALTIGLLAGAGAIGFRWLIEQSQSTFFFGVDQGLEALRELPWWKRLLIPAVGGLLVGPIVYRLAPETRGSGVPEVMESAAFRGGFIRARVLAAKSLAAALTIGSGGSAGREGPIVQIGSAMGSVLGQVMSVSPRRLRTFLACGAAAGIAATFNAPIAGALFAVEVILGEFAVMQFSPIVISSVTATVLSRHVLGDSPAFGVPEYDLLRAAEFVPYTVLGLLAGLTSVVFIGAVYRTQDLFAALRIRPWMKPAIGGLIVGIIALWAPEVFGVGYQSVDAALHGRLPLLILLALVPAKMLATAATLGSGGSGGIFAPSLFIGAMLGGAVGHIAGLWMDGIASPGAYALVGMGAVVAGATHGPISAILIIFELTGDYRIFPPLMVACILSVLLSTGMKRDSMYTMKLTKRGINLHEGKDVNVLRSLYVRDVFDTAPSRVPGSLDIHEVVDRMLHDSRENFFVVGPDDRLLGSFSLKDLRELMFEHELPPLVVAADVARADAPVVRMDDNLDLVMHLFGQHDVEEIGVVERGPGRKLLGSVRRKQVIDAYNREIFRVDLTGGFHSVATAVEQDRGVELAAGYRLVEVGAPYAFVGRTIRRINVRARYGVEIILIRKPPETEGDIQGRPGAFPHPGYRLETGDTLLVMGTEENIRRFREALPPTPAADPPPGEGPDAGV